MGTPRHPLGVSALLLVAALVLSGCAGARAKTVPDPDPYIQPTGFTENTGSVVGTVVDDEFVPLKDAIVGFIDPYQATKTDQFGHFEIGLLAPAKRNLYVIHLGHMADGKRIEIKVGQATEVLFILPVLPIEEPWVDVVYRVARFSQNVRIDPMASSTLPLLNSTVHEWRVKDKPHALEGLYLEAEWTQSQTLSGGIRIAFGLGRTSSRETFFTLDGKSPLAQGVNRTEIEDVWKRSLSVCVKDPCYLRWSATPSTKTTNLPVDFGIMIDQSFEVYVSHFFRMQRPETYTALP